MITPCRVLCTLATMREEATDGVRQSPRLAEIRKHGHVLTPGRYVGAQTAEDEAEPFDDKMKRLATTLRAQHAEAANLDAAIAASLKELGYWATRA